MTRTCAPEVLGQAESVAVEVRDDDRVDAPGGEGGDGGEPDRTAHPTTMAISPGPIPELTNVELSDRERINQGNGVVRYPIADGTGHGLGDDEELAKTALGFGVLADHLGAGQAAIHEEDGHRRDPGADGELISAPRTVVDDLAHKLVAQDDVSTGVVDHSGAPCGHGVVVVHEVHVRGADGGCQRSEQELTLARHRVECLPHLETTVPQHHCPHPYLLLIVLG